MYFLVYIICMQIWEISVKFHWNFNEYHWNFNELSLKFQWNFNESSLKFQWYSLNITEMLENSFTEISVLIFNRDSMGKFIQSTMG